MNSIKIGSLLVVFLIGNLAQGQVSPMVKQGSIDLRNYNFSQEPSVKLNGEWEFYWNELFAPSEIKGPVTYGYLPEPWTTSKGTATYRLRVVLNPQFKNYGLELPQLYSAYKLWINGKQVAENGVIGATRKSIRPQWLPQLVAISSPSDTLSLVLQVANFNHSTGGLKNPLVLGLTSELSPTRSFAEIVNKVLFAILILSGVIFLIVYFTVKKEKSILFFSLMCLVWAIRSIFSELYLVVQWFPEIDWELLVKVEYLTIYLEVCFAILVLSKLYPRDTQKFITNPILYLNYLFIFLTMATPAVVYTRFLTIYLSVAGFTILYAIFVITRAIVYDRYGARFSVMGVLAGASAFGYNMLSYLGLFEFNPAIYYSCYLIAFAFIGIAIGYQLSPNAAHNNVNEKLTFEDLMSGS